MQIRTIIEKIKTDRLSPLDLAKLNDKQTIHFLEHLRWGHNGGKPFCPKCGNCKVRHYISTRNQYRCGEANCGLTFTVTNRTIFHNHSLQEGGISSIVFGIALMAENLTIQEISNITGINYQTIFLYYHKLLATFIDRNQDEGKLSGVVEMDGIYFYRYNTKHKKEGRVGISLRERGEKGSSKTRFFVSKSENAYFIEQIAEKYIEKGSEIHTDGHFAYTGLQKFYKHKSVNHNKEYVTPEGVNNNQCESINSEVRFAIDDRRRGVKKTYFLSYLNFFAHNADMRSNHKGSKKELLSKKIVDLLTRAVSYQVPDDLINYSKNNHPIGEYSGL